MLASEPSRMASGWVNLIVVGLLHAALVYALLVVSVRNELIVLPLALSVRLLPMLEEPTIPAKPLPPPPPKVPVRKQPVVQPQPVLAVATPGHQQLSPWTPQPPAPPAQPIAAPPAPVLAPASLIAARFDAGLLCITPSRFTPPCLAA